MLLLRVVFRLVIGLLRAVLWTAALTWAALFCLGALALCFLGLGAVGGGALMAIGTGPLSLMTAFRIRRQPATRSAWSGHAGPSDGWPPPRIGPSAGTVANRWPARV